MNTEALTDKSRRRMRREQKRRRDRISSHKWDHEAERTIRWAREQYYDLQGDDDSEEEEPDTATWEDSTQVQAETEQ